MPTDIKTSQDLEDHMLSYELPKLEKAIIDMTTMFGGAMDAWREEAKNLRKDMEKMNDKIDGIADVQIQMAQLIAENKNNEKSLDSAWSEIKQSKLDMKTYVSERVGSVYLRISSVAAVAGVLVAFIYMSDKDQVTYHMRDDGIHKRTK
jgi:hypothetical protein